jgi:hypothetical protein
MSGRITSRQQLSLALLSGSGIFLEIALTRLFSTLFYSPYVFAIISVAILGLGLGAALATGRAAWRLPRRLPLYLVLAGYASLILLLAAVWTASLDLRGGLLALVTLPYLFIGLALATLFSAAPANSPDLYRADLLGAGLGAILAIPFLNLLGGINSIMLAAGLLGLAAQVGWPRLKPGRARSSLKSRLALAGSPLSLSGLVIIALFANLTPGLEWLTLDMSRLASAKPITQSLAAGGQIIDTTWDSFARTDLVDPGEGKPYELYLDGAAGSVVPRTGDLNLLRTDIGFFPFATAQPKQVLVVGPGGGLDVWFGLNSRAQRITAVEVNPASVDVVNEFGPYNGNLYRQAGVEVLIDEGRSVLRREGRQYDLIYLSQVVTLAAERSGYVLTENTVYTVEAFKEYLAHLQAGGQIALKLYDELTLTRAMVTAVTALREARGLSDAEAMAHLAIFLDSDADPAIPLLLVRDQPFSRDEAVSLAGVAAQVDFAPLFVPGVAGGPSLQRVLDGAEPLSSIVANSPSDVSATRDDRPFFYEFEPGLPLSLLPLLWGLGAISLAGLVALIIIQRPFSQGVVRYAPIYFAALGLGFIMVEITLIQQTRLFLGHPTLAVTTVLAVLLIGGGIGSHLAGRWWAGAEPDQNSVPDRKFVWPLAGIVLMVILWLLIWPWLNQAFLASTTLIRIVIVSISLLPLALLLGIPFPSGLRLVGQFEHGDRHVALAWAVNGAMTVVGSAGAVAIAILAGFSSVLWVGAGAYVIAALVAYLVLRSN